MQFFKSNYYYLNWTNTVYNDWPVLWLLEGWFELDEDHTWFSLPRLLHDDYQGDGLNFIEPGFTMNARDPNPEIDTRESGERQTQSLGPIMYGIYWLFNVWVWTETATKFATSDLKYNVLVISKTGSKYLWLCTDSQKQRREEKGKLTPFSELLCSRHNMCLLQRFDTQRGKVGGFDQRRFPTVHDPQ